MSKSRDAILARLRAGDTGEQPPKSDFSVLAEKHWSRGAKIERLETMMAAVNTELHRTTEASWPGLIADLLKKRDIGSLLIGTNNRLMDRLQEAWKGQEGSPEIELYDRTYEDERAEVFSAPASLTSTRGGIAETGSLILWPNAAEPRLLSLVPPVHIALLDADSLHNTFWQAMTSEGWKDGLPTNALLISGPSKTADIEQELTYGVHGPKELIVLVIDG